MKLGTTCAVVLAAILVCSGCASMHDVVRSEQRGGGTTQRYFVPADTAWDIARSVLRWEGHAEHIEEHRAEGYMLGASDWQAFTWGTYMGVWLAPESSGAVRVTVVTKRKMSTNFITTLTETTFHKRFEEAAVESITHVHQPTEHPGIEPAMTDGP
jgi:hypothetical protein